MAVTSKATESTSCPNTSTNTGCPRDPPPPPAPVVSPGAAAPNFVVCSYYQGQIKAVELAKYSSPVLLLFYPAQFDLGLASELAQLAGFRDQLPAGTVVMAATTDYVEAAQVWAEMDVAKGGLKGYDVIFLR